MKSGKFVEAGQGLVEYAILLGLLALVVLGGLTVAGGGVRGVFERIADLIGVHVTIPTPPPSPGDLQDITVIVVDSEKRGIAAVEVHVFNGDSGDYIGLVGKTNDAGEVVYPQASPGPYAFRADYQARKFFSPIITAPEEKLAVIQTGQRPFKVRVIDAKDKPIAGVTVFAFTAAENYYTGVEAITDAEGIAVMPLADGDYKFRADYQNLAYWSAVASTPAVSSTTIQITACARLQLGGVTFLGPGGGVDGGRVALRVEGAGEKVTIIRVDVDWAYLDSLPNEPGGNMRLYGIYLCPGSSTECSNKGRWLNIIYPDWSTNMDDDTSPSSAGDNPQVLAANGGYLIFDFDSLKTWDSRRLDGPPWYLKPTDFGFTVHFKECPAISRAAVPR